MLRRSFVLVALAAMLIMVTGCTKQDPEFTANDQVAAADRAAEEASGEGGGGEGGGEAAGGPTVTWAASSGLEYTEAPEEVPAGGATFELTCEGTPHDVTIEGYEGDEPVVVCDGEGSFTGNAALEPGDYTYYCSVPGHRPAGMEGEITVQ